MSATDDLVAFAETPHRLPGKTRANAERLLADTLAVGAAGVGAPGEPEILTVAQGMGAGMEARLLGTDARLPAAGAAFVSGYRIHCLEWDAVHEPAVVHALSTVTAALGAAIDRQGGCDAERALYALTLGVDIASGIGLACDTGLSFFRPATAGLLGASVAVAWLDDAPIRDTLGLAYSSAAGTMQAHVEGSATLPFQIANAARAAIVASDLAKAGFSGPQDMLEGQFGFFNLFEKGDLSRYTDRLGKVWRIDEISVKPYPSGRASHGALGQLEALALDPGDVAALELACPPLIRRLLGRPWQPEMTPAYARLCLQFLSALMLTDGFIDPRRFTPGNFADPALGALAQRLTMVPDGNEDPNDLSPQLLRVTHADGDVREHLIPNTLGSPHAPLSEAQAANKLGLARSLASDRADPRIFDDPVGYFTRPA